ncbi:MAG: NUDIX domain-containing protein, partial [Candidatus Omnitrophica bacterium]|nr:NUDIX domain-containing protein [Candidatus Omnitrophota bacterium]
MNKFKNFSIAISVFIVLCATLSPLSEARRTKYSEFHNIVKNYLIQNKDTILGNEGRLYLNDLYASLGIESEEDKKSVLEMLGQEDLVGPIFKDNDPDNKEFLQIIKKDPNGGPLFQAGIPVLEEGYVCLRGFVHKNAEWHQAVHVLIITRDGKIILQTRSSAADSRSAGKKDISVGGQVPAGMSFRDTALEETKEETGLSIDSDRLIGPSDLIAGYEQEYFIKVAINQPLLGQGIKVVQEAGKAFFYQIEGETQGSYQNFEVTKIYIVRLEEGEKPAVNPQVTEFTEVELRDLIFEILDNKEIYASAIQQYILDPNIFSYLAREIYKVELPEVISDGLEQIDKILQENGKGNIHREQFIGFLIPNLVKAGLLNEENFFSLGIELAQKCHEIKTRGVIENNDPIAAKEFEEISYLPNSIFVDAVPALVMAGMINKDNALDIINELIDLDNSLAEQKIGSQVVFRDLFPLLIERGIISSDNLGDMGKVLTKLT